VKWKELFTRKEIGCILVAILLILTAWLILIGLLGCKSTNITPWRIRLKAEMRPHVQLEVSRGEAAVQQPPAKFEEIEQ